jgi:hypothetical protein
VDAGMTSNSQNLTFLIDPVKFGSMGTAFQGARVSSDTSELAASLCLSRETH